MQELLTTQFVGRHFLYFDELDSTNAYCKENAASLPDGTVVMAALQTCGRGRMGRPWQSRAGTGVYLSILLHDQTADELRLLPLLAGVAVCEALERLYGPGFSIKWSNDILLHGKKVCGILCESRILGRRALAVVGIGVNATQTRQDFDSHALVYATSLQLATGKNLAFPAIAAEILNHFEKVLLVFRQKGFFGIRTAYKERCITLGREVRILAGPHESRGTAVDIADDGSLLCNIDGVLRPICAGEVSIRGVNGYV